MDQPVEDGVCHSGIADHFMPVFNRQLAGDYCAFEAMPVLQDFQYIAPLLGTEGGQSPVIQQQDIHAGERAHQLRITSVPPGDMQVLQQSGNPVIHSGVPVPAGLLRQGTGQPGFADTFWACQQHILGAFAGLLMGSEGLKRK